MSVCERNIKLDRVSDQKVFESENELEIERRRK